MSSFPFASVRGSALAALLAGAGWFAVSLDSLVRPDPERYRDALVLIPWVLTAAGIAGLHRLQRPHAGRLEQTGFWLVMGAMLAVFVGNIAMVTETESLIWLGFPVGALGWAVGMLLVGLATVRLARVPRWCGVALMLSQPLTMVVAIALSPIAPLSDEGSYTGAIVHAIVWTALGVVLWSRRHTRVAPAAGRGRLERAAG